MSECSSWAELDKITIASGFVAPAAVTATEAPKEAPTSTTRRAPSARALSTISFHLGGRIVGNRAVDAIRLAVIAQVEQGYPDFLFGKEISVKDEAAEAVPVALMQQDRYRLSRPEPCAVQRYTVWRLKCPLGDPSRNFDGTEPLGAHNLRERRPLGSCVRDRRGAASARSAIAAPGQRQHATDQRDH
jgi:hypothetical protein